MAIGQFTTSKLVFVLVIALCVEFSTCVPFKGSVSCLDCPAHYDLSDIKVSIKCSQVKKLAMATTEKDGTFVTDLPSNTPTQSSLPNCLAKIVGGPNQLYVSNKNMVYKVLKASQDDNVYNISSSLEFYSLCPLPENMVKSGAQHGNPIGSSKTVDLPLPREWGLAPTSYYVPFFPIGGIP